MKVYNNEKLIKENNYNTQENNLMMIKSVNFSLISSLNNKIIGLTCLNSIINKHLLKIKVCVYVNLLSNYYDIKDNDNYINIRKLLSNILLKNLINKKYHTLKYYFYKFHSHIFSLQNLNEQLNQPLNDKF